MHDAMISAAQRGAETLFALARQARLHAVCPYSRYAVGAALMDESGRIWLGANIENGAYSPTICAERVALSKAVFDGARQFVMIAVAGGDVGVETVQDCAPCGVCRQALSEFFMPQTRWVFSQGGTLHVCDSEEMMPYAFALR